MPRTIIETQNLRKVYGMGAIQVNALDGVDLQIHAGEFVAIMGQSGSGKSTLMNIIGCLDRPTGGAYFLDGQNVSGLNKVQLAGIRNRQIGFVFQSFNLLARTSALRNVMLPLVYKRGGSHSVKEREAIAMNALEAVGLADRATHEPTGNLDSQTSAEILELLHDLHARGRTIVMVTHEAEIATRTGRIIHMRDGRIEPVNDERRTANTSLNTEGGANDDR